MTGLCTLAVGEEGLKANVEWLSSLPAAGLLALGVLILGSILWRYSRRDDSNSADLRKELQRWQDQHLATLKDSAAQGQRMMIALEASTVAVTANTAIQSEVRAALTALAHASDAQARALVDVRMAANLDAADEMQAKIDSLRIEVMELRRSAPARVQHVRKRGTNSESLPS